MLSTIICGKGLTSPQSSNLLHCAIPDEIVAVFSDPQDTVVDWGHTKSLLTYPGVWLPTAASGIFFHPPHDMANYRPPHQ